MVYYRILANGFCIQWGKQNSVNGTINYNLTAQYTQPPMVFAMVNNWDVTTHAIIGNVTKSSFSCRAGQYYTWGEARNMFWMSIGY